MAGDPTRGSQFIALPVMKLAAIEAHLNQHSQNSRPGLPRPIRRRRYRDRPKPHGANPKPKARSQGISTSNVTSCR
jgi:hypothetical protein